MSAEIPETVDLRKYIDTSIFGERPHIRGRRVPVSALAYNARSQGWSVPELAYQFTVSEPEALAALLYYQEHRAQIDEQEAAYQAELDEAYEAHNPSSD